MRLKILVAVSVVLAGSVVACRHTRRLGPIPSPDKAIAVAPANAQPSDVNLFVTVKTAAVAKAIDDLIGWPKQIISEGNNPVQWGIYAFPATSVETKDGNRLVAKILLTYRVGVPGLASCGYGSEAPPKAHVVVTTAPLGVERDWKITGAPTVDLDLFEPCRVTFLGFDVRGLIKGKAQPFLDQLQGQLAAELGKLPLRDEAQKAWDSLQRPVELAPQLWLAASPDRVVRSEVMAAGDSMTFTFGIVARPSVHYASVAPTFTPVPLPPLEVAAPSNHFHIDAFGTAAYDAMTNALRKELIGQTFSNPKARWPLKRLAFRIRDVEVFGSGDKMAMRVDITGSAEGSLFFVGTPRFEGGVKSLIAVRDAQFSYESRRVLEKVASWILDSAIEAKLREQSLDITDRLGETANKLTTVLNRDLAPGVRMTGKAGAPVVDRVYPSAEGLVVHGLANGSIEVTVSN